MARNDLRRLPVIIRGWTWCFGALVALSTLSGVAYCAMLLNGKPALPRPLDTLIYLAFATMTIGALVSRHAARHRLTMALDRAEARAERTSVHEALIELRVALDAHAGVPRVRMVVGGTHPTTDGESTERTERLGTVVGKASVYASAPLKAEVVELGARLARRLTVVDD